MAKKLSASFLLVVCVLSATRAWPETFVTNIVSGVSSNAGGPITVGSNGSFNYLRIETNSTGVAGSLTNTTGTIGSGDGGSNNTVMVTGNNSLWNNTGAGGIIVGNNGADNNLLVISNGARVVAAKSSIGSGGTANSNQVVVTGSNSLWTNTAGLFVGEVQCFNSRLTISNGGKVINTDGTIGSSSSASSNVVLVTGNNSVWANSGNLVIGGAGDKNLLQIDNGGIVSNVNGTIGNTSTASSNTVMVGVNSLWNNSGGLFIGRAGGNANQLIITNGGLVASTGGTFSDNNTSFGNLAFVTGTNSTWNVQRDLIIGDAGDGNVLTITDDGKVLASNVVVGLLVGSDNNSIVLDGGSLILTSASNAATLDIRRGTNFLNSGTVTADKLVLVTGASGRFIFNGGVLNTKSTLVTNTFAFVVGDGNGNTATLNFVGGVHNFNAGITNQSDGFITGGGVVNSPFQVANFGSIVATSATVELRFTNSLTVGNSGSLGATANATLTFGGTSGSALVTNFGTVAMSGGTFRAGNLTNLVNGAIVGFGIFSNNVVNLGSLRATNGTLALTTSLTNASTGSISISSDGTLSVVPAWVNVGSITDNGGQLIGGNVTNATGASVSGQGTILANLFNQGTTAATNGELRLQGVVNGAGTYRAVAASTLTFVTGGSISALFNTGATIRVDGVLTNASLFVNQGTLVVAGGTYHSTFAITNAASRLITGFGTITGSMANLGDVVITNGTLRLLTSPSNVGTISVSSSGTLDVAPAWANDGTLFVMGGTVQGGDLTNNALGTVRNAGTISSLFINFGTLQAVGGAGLNINGATNAVGASILISNSALTTSGQLRNAGTVSFFHSVGTFHSGIVNSGYWITDPTTNIYESAFTNTTSGVIQMAAGDVFIFRTNTTGGTTAGSFVNISTNNVANDMLGGKFVFENTTLTLTQNLYAAGHDLNQTGATTPTNQIILSSLGYSTNFALGTLEIANATTVRVSDAFITGGPGTNDDLRAALYVTNLVMGANSFLIISSNVSVYFITSNQWSAGNFTLLGGSTLANQGQLHQFLGVLATVPEPNVLLLWASGIVTVYASRRRAQRTRRSP